MAQENIIEIQQLKTVLGDHAVHDGLDMSVRRGEIVAIVGGSGTGKSTLLRIILMLLQPQAGSVNVFGTDILNCTADEAKSVRRRLGMMFQQGALFTSLNLMENVMFPLQELTHLSPKIIKDLALLKIALVGLPSDAASKFPSELSGGMQKRAAVARAIATDPELLFLDEPTAGLDPHGATALDDLVLHLRDTLGLTIVMVTHDLDTLWRVTDRVAFLGEGKVLAMDSMDELVKSEHPIIRGYFSGPRGQVIRKVNQ